MPATSSPQRVSGIDLHVERSGSGDPLVLVHGSWGSTARWALITDELARSYDVVSYDRRGHSGSSRSTAARPTRRDHEDDLAALIEQLGIAPAHVVGSSYGGAVALSLAARRPDLIRSVSAHEPPLVAFGGDDPSVARADEQMAQIAELIEAGDSEGGARAFLERIALGPGAWDMLPPELTGEMVRNAHTFAAEQRDRAGGSADLSTIECPVLLTRGDASLEWFTPIVAGLVEAIPHASLETIAGSGHAPHLTHPDEYVELITRFAA